MMLMSGAGLDALIGMAGNDKAKRVSNMQTMLSIVSAQSKSTLALDPEKMLALLDAVGMKDGKTTEEFRNYLLAATSVDANGKSLAAAATFRFLASPAVQASPNAAAAIAAVAQSIDPATLKEKNHQNALALLRTNTPQLLTLVRELGADKADKVMNIIASGKYVVLFQEPAVNRFIDTLDTRGLPADLRDTVQAVKSMPPAARLAAADIQDNGIDPQKLRKAFMKTDKDDKIIPNKNGQPEPDMDKALRNILSGKARANIRLAGTDNIATIAQSAGNGLVSKRNLDALLAFGDKVDGQDKTKTDDDRTLKIMRAMLQKIIHPAATETQNPFEKVSAEELQTLFKQHGAAFGTLLGALDPKGLPCELVSLRDHWQKLGKMAASPAGSKLILEQLIKPSGDKTSDWLTSAHLSIKGNHLGWNGLTSNEIGEAKDAIMALKRATESCTLSTASATNLPRLPVAGYQPVRSS